MHCSNVYRSQLHPSLWLSIAAGADLEHSPLRLCPPWCSFTEKKESAETEEGRGSCRSGGQFARLSGGGQFSNVFKIGDIVGC